MIGSPSQLPATRSEQSNRVYGSALYEFFQGEYYKRVTCEVNWVGNPHTLWASVGSSLQREKILFNENSALIIALKQAAHIRCQNKSITEVLHEVNNIINELTHVPGEKVEVTEKNLDNALDNFLAYHFIPGQQLLMTMDYLMQTGLLVCRHKALIACAVLRHLVEQGVLPNGSVRQYRADLPVGAHTWTMYRDFNTGMLYLCDPRGRQYGNLSTAFTHFERIYTMPVLQFMIQRLDAQDVYLRLNDKLQDEVIPLPFKVNALRAENDPARGLTLCFEFAKGDRALQVLGASLAAQRIYFNYGDSKIYVSIAENPNIYHLDVAKLLDTFKTISPFLLAPPIKPLLFTRPAHNTFKLEDNFSFVDIDLQQFEIFDRQDKDYTTQNKIFSRFTLTRSPS